MKDFVRLLSLAVFSLYSVISYASSPLVSVPGTSVTMEAPVGFELAPHFAGFENVETGSTILVIELPKSAYEPSLAVFKDINSATLAFRRQGVDVTELSELHHKGKTVYLVKGTQVKKGIEYLKVIALVKGEETIMITLNSVDGGVQQELEFKKAVESVTLSQPLSLADKVKSLPFEVEIKAPFIPFQVVAGSSLSLTTKMDAKPDKGDPFVSIAVSQVSGNDKEMKAFMDQFVGQMTNKLDVSSTIEAFNSGDKTGYKTTMENDKFGGVVAYMIKLDSEHVMFVLGMGNKKEFSSVAEQVNTAVKTLAWK